MDQARPLRAVFDELSGDEDARQAHTADPGGTLSAAGHADLPGELVAEAIVSFADTAPVEVAEHLAPYVMSHSAVPLDAADGGIDPMNGLDLLTTAPVGVDLDADAEADADDGTTAMAATEPSAAPDDLGFGAGSDWLEPAAQPGTVDEASVGTASVDIGAAAGEDEIVSFPDEPPLADALPLLDLGADDNSADDNGAIDNGAIE